MAVKTRSTTMAEAEPIVDRSQLKQPTRHIEPPPPSEFDDKGRTREPDTSQATRGRTIEGIDPATGQHVKGEIVPSASTGLGLGSPLDQLRAQAAANDVPVESRTSPVAGLTTTESIQPRFTDPATQAPKPVVAAPNTPDPRTQIRVGQIDDAHVAVEKIVRVRPKSTFSRFIGPFRYYFTKDVTCEVPVSVRDALLREELAYPVYTE